MAASLSDETKRLVSASHVEVTARRITPVARALRSIDDQGTDIMRKQKSAAQFYKFVSEFKNGIGEDDGKETPTLENFRDKLVDKLAGLLWSMST